LSEALADRLPALLSGGQRQRVALARALVVNPPLPMFDEPLSNRGARLRVEMRAEIRTLHRANGTTAIFATHDREGAFSISDRVASMHRGRILQYAAPEVLEEPPASAFVARFVGFENPIPMRGVARQGGGATAEARGVTLDLPEQRDEGGARVEEPVAVCAGRPRLTPSVRPHPPCSVGMARMARVANRSRSGQTENRRGEKVGSRIRSMPSAAARRHPARRGASRKSRLRAASTLANASPAAQGEVFRRGGRARPHGRGTFADPICVCTSAKPGTADRAGRSSISESVRRVSVPVSRTRPTRRSVGRAPGHGDEGELLPGWSARGRR
jgi:energy-coupling factor transporter ATP-binding protein EcfA2